MLRFFLCALGLMLIFEGLPYFAFPEKLKVWLARASETNAGTLRILGFLSIVAGTLIVYFNRPS